MPSSFLALDANNGGTLNILNYTGGTVDVVGQPGGSTTAFVSAGMAYHNRIIYYNGMIVYSAQNGIYTSVTDGKTGVLRHTYVAAVTGSNIYGPVVVGGHLCVIYTSAGNLVRMAKSTDGIAWSEQSVSWSGAYDIRGVAINNGIVHVVGNGTEYVAMNPETGTNSSLNFAGISGFNGAYTWNGTPFGLGVTNGVSIRVINLNTSATFATVSAGHFSTQNGLIAFVDPNTDELIIISSTLLRSWSVSSVGVVTERTSTMITGSYFASLSSLAGVYGPVIDQIEAVGFSPTIYIHVSASRTVASTPTVVMRYNGTGSRLGDAAGQPNYSGGGSTISHSIPSNNVSSNRNWLPRPDEAGLVQCIPTAEVLSITGPLINRVRLNFRANKAWQQRLEAISGGPATFDLSTSPLSVSPIKPGSVAIQITISGSGYYAEDDGSGNFPASTVLPTGGTINYSTAILNGITATADDATNVRALFVGGSGTLQLYRNVSDIEYPASQTGQLANLTEASQGTASGTIMFNFEADGSEHNVDVNMAGFLNGDIISIAPYIY